MLKLNQKHTYLLFLICFASTVNCFSQSNACKFIFKNSSQAEPYKQVYSTVESELGFLNTHLNEAKKVLLEKTSNKSFNEAILNLADLNNHALDVLIYMLKNQNLFNNSKGQILLYKNLQSRILKFFIFQGYTIEQVQNFVQSRFSLIQTESTVKNKSNKIGFIISESDTESSTLNQIPIGFTNTQRLEQPYGRTKQSDREVTDNVSKKVGIGFLTSDDIQDLPNKKLSSIGFLQETVTDVGYQLSLDFDQRSSLFITKTNKPKIGF